MSRLEELQAKLKQVNEVADACVARSADSKDKAEHEQWRKLRVAELHDAIDDELKAEAVERRRTAMPVALPHVDPTPGRWSAVGARVYAGDVKIADCSLPGGEYLTRQNIDKVERVRWESGTNARHMAQAKRALELLEAVLLFHSASPWTVEKSGAWTRLVGVPDATTKALCDQIRKTLNDAGRGGANAIRTE